MSSSPSPPPRHTGPTVWITYFAGRRWPRVSRASPAGQPPSARHSCSSPGPAARWIAPSTPPPPRRLEFAALTIASSASVVMSVWSASMAAAIAPLFRGFAPAHAERAHIGFEQRLLLVEIGLVHFPDLHDLPHDLDLEAVRLGLRIDVANIVGERLLFFLEALDPLDERFQALSGDPARLRHETLRLCDGRRPYRRANRRSMPRGANPVDECARERVSACAPRRRRVWSAPSGISPSTPHRACHRRSRAPPDRAMSCRAPRPPRDTSATGNCGRSPRDSSDRDSAHPCARANAAPGGEMRQPRVRCGSCRRAFDPSLVSLFPWMVLRMGCAGRNCHGKPLLRQDRPQQPRQPLGPAPRACLLRHQIL